MVEIDELRQFLAEERGLAVVGTTQADGRVLSSVVNCGVLEHPESGVLCVAFVSRGKAARLTHVRRGSPVTIAVRRGWRWRSVTGPATIFGPDDRRASTGDDALRLLLRRVFEAAGGTHDDFDEYDRVMAEERRAAVFVTPERILGNG